MALWLQIDGATGLVAVIDRKGAFFIDGDTCIAVVRRIADDHEDRLLPLDFFCGFSLFVEFFKDTFGRIEFRIPTGEGIREINARSLSRCFIERQAAQLLQQSELQVCDDEWGGEKFKTEDSLRCGSSDFGWCQSPVAVSCVVRFNPSQHLDQIRARAATGVEHVYRFVGQAILASQVVAEDLIDAADHVLHDLRRRVPDAELLAQFGVELFEERLVEILHRFGVVEPREERGPIDAVQHVARPVQHFFELPLDQLPRLGEFVKQLPQHRHAQILCGFLPVEAIARRRVTAMPKHPRGEDAVEERLHERAAEEATAFFLLGRLEREAERLFERALHVQKRRHVPRTFHARLRIAGITGEEPRHIFRLRNRGRTQQAPLQEIEERRFERSD